MDSPLRSVAPIVDGDRERDEPAVVVLMHDYGGMCTGTVIAPRVVLTAKHCVCEMVNENTVGSTLGAWGFHVFVGADLYSIEDEYGVEEVIRAPGSSLDNSDFGLLILDRDFEQGIKRWEFAPWPGMERDATITAIGYGQTEYNEPYTFGYKYRRDGRVSDIGPDDRWGLGDREFMSDGENTCQGDSGGPLLFEDVVVGIVSRGEEGCVGWGWDTRVSGFADLINEALADTGACVPTAFESCNGLDDDCWGGVDDGLGGTCACEGGAAPSDEECNGVDDDCDGEIDDLDACACTGGAAPSDEVCDGIDNDCDDELDEGCLRLGEPCERDDECSSSMCQEVGGEDVCTQECVAGVDSCPDESFCDGPACGAGLCRVGRGEGRIGDECSGASDCRTGFCAPSPGERSRCARPCAPGAAGCFATEICGRLEGECGACIARDSAEGEVSDLGFGEPCLDDDECSSGQCLVDGDEDACGDGCTYRYCVEECGEDDACPDGDGVQAHCRDGLCVRGPASELGETCMANADCAEGECVEHDEVFRCVAECGDEQSCDDGTECIDDEVCWPEGVVPGDPCDDEGDECGAGVCEEFEGTLLCVVECDRATDCPAGQACVPEGNTGHGLCVPSSLSFADDAGDARGCDCVAAGDSRPDTLLWVLGLAWVAARRLRLRSL